MSSANDLICSFSVETSGGNNSVVMLVVVSNIGLRHRYIYFPFSESLTKGDELWSSRPHDIGHVLHLHPVNLLLIFQIIWLLQLSPKCCTISLNNWINHQLAGIPGYMYSIGSKAVLHKSKLYSLALGLSKRSVHRCHTVPGSSVPRVIDHISRFPLCQFSSSIIPRDIQQFLVFSAHFFQIGINYGLNSKWPCHWA